MLLLSLKTDVRDAWYNLCIMIDNLIYSMVSYSYRIFLLLANGTPFKYDDYKAITLRIYVVLGIIMMFVMTYELFILIINPDDTKNSNPGKLIINICLTVVVLVLLPTLFGFLANTQNAFLNNDFLGKLILGTGYDTSGSSTSCDGSSDTIRRGGNMIAGQVFQSFFVPADGKDAADIKTDEGDGSFVCLTQSNGVPLKSSDLQSAFNCASTYGNFDVFYKFSGRAAEGDITFNALFSILAGVFLCYVIISFCFDLGIRVVKIAFLQLIAPIPVILRIIPKGKDIFNNWFKMLISVYLEAFVRIASMYLGVFLIALFLKSDTTWISNCENNKFLLLLAKAFVIMGIFASIKILPEMLKKLFPGMDSSGMKLGIKDKLKAGGAFMAGAAVGGLTGSMLNSGVNSFKNVRKKFGEINAETDANGNELSKSRKFWKKAGAVAGTGVGGFLTKSPRFLTSAYNAGAGAKDASTLKDTGAAVNTGIAKGMSSQNIVKRAFGAVEDFGTGVKNISNTSYSPYDSKRELARAAKYDSLKSRKDKIMGIIDEDKRVKAIDSIYQKRMESVTPLNFPAKQEKDKFTGAWVTIPERKETMAEAVARVQKEWDDEKDDMRQTVYLDKMGKGDDPTKSDRELISQVGSYRYEIGQNQEIVDKMLREDGTLASGESFNVNTDNIKDLNVLGRSAGKVSVEIHNKAIEEEAKQQPKSGS